MKTQPEGSARRSRVLAVSSGGGHWVQLLRLKPAFANHEVTFVTVREFYRDQVADSNFLVVNDATRWNKMGLILLAMRIARIVLAIRPDVVISTGAAPGYFALLFGKLIGSKTIWLDSIANVDQLSMSGRIAGRVADLWLTQWPHLAKEEGPDYRGAVL